MKYRFELWNDGKMYINTLTSTGNWTDLLTTGDHPELQQSSEGDCLYTTLNREALLELRDNINTLLEVT